MRLIYTDINNDLTHILTDIAYHNAKAGQRVFYIAPNSLSFEKERQVLEHLPEKASFQITVTRFAQLARYLVLNRPVQKTSLDDTGLSMVFYKALSQLNDSHLKLYGKLKQDAGFIKQLVELYKDLQSSNAQISDLETLENKSKFEDLQLIFAEVNQILLDGNFDNQSAIDYLIESLETQKLSLSYSDVTLVIDGFTRFSAEEERLVSYLHYHGVSIIIGTYMTEKAYKLSFYGGNIFETSISFMRSLSSRFQTKVEYINDHHKTANAFFHFSKTFEALHDFSEIDVVNNQKDDAVLIWQTINQKDEIEQVAKAIREKLYQGYRYKDILVLLGDVEAYELQVKVIFDKYDIPYYIGKSESMSQHSLIQFFESLERLKKYNWRREDIMTLLKSQLSTHFDQELIDKFNQYLQYADINGFTKFNRTFSYQNQNKYDLEELNRVRQAVVEPLSKLLKVKAQKGSSLLKKLLNYLETIQFAEHFQSLSQELNEIELEKQEQVWKVFTTVISEFNLLFSDDTLSIEKALSLIKNGMLAGNYRVVPATIDVVNVKSYDLVEPHTNKFVFAIGLTASHFPKQVTQHSLLSDEERIKLNENLIETSDTHFDVASIENTKKSHFTAVSLFHSASQNLILSSPTVVNESQDDMSPYLKELTDIGVPVSDKKASLQAINVEDIGNDKALLSRIISINQDKDTFLGDHERTFWAAASRYLRHKLEEENLYILNRPNHLATKPLSKEVLDIKFPKNEPLNLSSSALTTFHNNQYLYYLQNVLALQEQESIHPDARNHGTYLHFIFENVMKDHSTLTFDQKLENSIEKANTDVRFFQQYQEDAAGRYSLSVLEDIARSTASILRHHQGLKVLKQEKPFSYTIKQKVKVNGYIDRIDQLDDGSYGVVDYKSSKNTFDIGRFYNGLSPQLVTYLSAIKKDTELNQSNRLFGAMYLHMLEPRLELAKIKEVSVQMIASLYQDLTYKGIFLEKEKEHLAGGTYQIKNALYSDEELEILLNYNNFLFEKAAKTIQSGKFLINPYTEDGKSVAGNQLKSITRFEADLDFGQARQLIKLPRTQKKENFLKKMQEVEVDDEL